MVSRRGVVLPGLLLVASSALAGCGSDDDADSAVADPTTPASTSSEVDSSTPSAGDAEIPEGTPACDDVWSEGAKLPRMYAGCEAGGVYVERDVITCSSGQRIVRFDDAFYAVLGGPVQAAPPSFSENEDYQEFLVGCRA
ncbi:hypothetical protein [Nocardioides sp.]|uniref:hypothetical protein n=1 Tax=Nocardioides sp. TaxID=35761 RepID=UPI002B26EF56|nr:hypothetical protein [Nocardioides sp.]